MNAWEQKFDWFTSGLSDNQRAQLSEPLKILRDDLGSELSDSKLDGALEEIIDSLDSKAADSLCLICEWLESHEDPFFEFTLENAEEMNQRHPESFWIPPKREREGVRLNDVVKLVFNGEYSDGFYGERMWVKVTSRDGAQFIGKLVNTPFALPLEWGQEIAFSSHHIIDIDPGGSLQDAGGTCEQIGRNGGDDTQKEVAV